MNREEAIGKFLLSFILIYMFHVKPINTAHWVQQENFQSCRRKVNWFLSSGTIRHEVSMSFPDNCMCCLLLCLTAISIVAFVNNRNILSLSRPLCANSTIRPAETGSLGGVVQSNNTSRYWLLVNNIRRKCGEKSTVFFSVSVSAL